MIYYNPCRRKNLPLKNALDLALKNTKPKPSEVGSVLKRTTAWRSAVFGNGRSLMLETERSQAGSELAERIVVNPKFLCQPS